MALLLLIKTEGTAPPEFAPPPTDDPEVDNDFRLYDQYISPDGVNYYLVGFKTPGTDRAWVHQYTLSTPWDITTMVHTGNSIEVTAQERWASAMDFRNDGSTMYIGGQHNGKVHEYALSTNWDLSTATFTASSPNQLRASIQGLVIKPDNGSRIYIASPHTSNEVEEFQLSSGWDATTISASPVAASTTVNATTSQISGLFIRDGGLYWYVTGYVSDDVNQHLSVAPYGTSTIAASIHTLDLTNQTSSPYGVFWRSDGTRMYILDNVLGGTAIQYNVGSPWTIASINN